MLDISFESLNRVTVRRTITLPLQHYKTEEEKWNKRRRGLIRKSPNLFCKGPVWFAFIKFKGNFLSLGIRRNERYLLKSRESRLLNIQTLHTIRKEKDAFSNISYLFLPPTLISSSTALHRGLPFVFDKCLRY